LCGEAPTLNAAQDAILPHPKSPLYHEDMVSRLACILLSAGLVMAQPAAAPDPGSAARKALDLFLGQKYSDLRQMFSPEASKGISEAQLQALGSQIQSRGVPKIGDPQVNPAGVNRVVAIPLTFSAVTINFQVAINPSGQITAFFLRQVSSAAAVPWERPAYSKPDSFQEREVTVGSDEWKLPGTLTVPAGKGPFPGIVLVHGSGPSDRDETLGAAKVFKDLAEGLASRGVAVLRYEKRTRQYAAKTAGLANFTVKGGTTEDAVRAAALLRTQPEVDPKRIFLLGYSLGGNLAPRIAQEDTKLAGLVILAGNVHAPEDAAVEQSEYLGASAAELQVMRNQAAKVKDLDQADASAPPVRVGSINEPVSYWLDLKGYDPTALAKKLTIPMLILQGERDFQVTMKEFDQWKAALSARKNVTFRSYPALNHLFVAGEGKSMPDEYSKPGHVAPEAIDDIAKFVVK